MRPEVHAAAIRSAAKLVLGMASIATFNVGCSADAVDKTSESNDAVITDDTRTTDASAPSACDATLDAAFPGKDRYQWQPVAQSAEVVACCKEAIADDHFGASHLYACCVAYDPAVSSEENPKTVAQSVGGFACTPWGPPVPPSMKRGRTMTPARQDMNTFLAAALEAA